MATFLFLKFSHFSDIQLMSDGRTDGRTDRPSYRDARTHLKSRIWRKIISLSHSQSPTIKQKALLSHSSVTIFSSLLSLSFYHDQKNKESKPGCWNLYVVHGNLRTEDYVYEVTVIKIAVGRFRTGKLCSPVIPSVSSLHKHPHRSNRNEISKESTRFFHKKLAYKKPG